MASKKKHPIAMPDVVRKAGQPGRVRRTGLKQAGAAGAGRKSAAARRSQVTTAARTASAKRATPRSRQIMPSDVEELARPLQKDEAAGSTPGLIELGLQVAAVPFVVPLYLTAAISRRLGLSGKQ